MATTGQLLAAIRLRAVKERPYFGSALFALTLVARPGHGTMSVDRWGRVYVDTSLVGQGNAWSVKQAACVLIHELGHWLRKHHERALPLLQIEPEETWPFIARSMNAAEDAELNDDLQDEGLDLPGKYVTPASLSREYGVPLDKHRLFEEYWLAIRDKAREDASRGAAGVREILEHLDCGSAAHGVPQPYELPAPSEGGEGIGAAEADLLRKHVAREIQEAAKLSPGSVPGSWRRWAADQLEPPVVPWERELAALCRNAVTMARGAVDYSYRKPSRRGTFHGILRPAMVRPSPEVGIEIDTSASMHQGALTAALRETQGILRSVGQRRCPVVCADAAVQTVQMVSRAFDVELNGGGGTDMGVGLEPLRRLGCKVIIVLTDAATDWPETPPQGCQLVVGVIGEDDEDTAYWRERLPSYVYRSVLIPPSQILEQGAA